MERLGRISVTACLLLTLGAPASARAENRKVRVPIGNTAIRTWVTNGRVRVGTECTKEFQNQDTRMEFYDRPARICAVWDEKQPVESATWELWKIGAAEKISHGPVPAESLAGTRSTLTIPLEPKLPLHNGTDKKQHYRVKILSKIKASDADAIPSVTALLVHLPKADQPKPQPLNPYVCTGAPDKYLRYVDLKVSRTSVTQTTSTSGDGDRDELYFKVARRGPGKYHGSRRLPAEDDYYEAKSDAELTDNYTNKDERRVAAPRFWLGPLKHGEMVTLAVTAMEQDNSDLATIKAQIIEAMLEVERVALETNNEYGAIVAGVAALVALHASLIPDTRGHDFIGTLVVRAENKCGHIRLVWTTFEEWKIDGIGTLRNKFVNWKDQTGFESRVIVLSAEELGFTPNGIDWGEYKLAGKADDFWWSAEGSSNARYTFTLESRLLPKKAAEEALKTLPDFFRK
jgi:hypothetical protein